MRKNPLPLSAFEQTGGAGFLCRIVLIAIFSACKPLFERILGALNHRLRENSTVGCAFFREFNR